MTWPNGTVEQLPERVRPTSRSRSAKGAGVVTDGAARADAAMTPIRRSWLTVSPRAALGRRALGLPAAAARAAPPIARAAYRANNVGVAFLEQFDYDKAADVVPRRAEDRSCADAGPHQPRASRSSTATIRTTSLQGRPPRRRPAAGQPAAALPPRPPRPSQNRPGRCGRRVRARAGRRSGDVGAKVNLAQVYRAGAQLSRPRSTLLRRGDRHRAVQRHRGLPWRRP